MDALDIVEILVPCGLAVFTFDFSGSGLSQGKYVSLGFFEQFDIQAVIDHLRCVLQFPNVAIWGRSMGAVAALLHASRDPQLSALVLDSPFASLPEVSKSLLEAYRWVPSSFHNSILVALRKRILKLAEFDLESVQPIKVVARCKAPAAFIHSIEDKVVPLAQAVRLYQQYPNPAKVILKVPGGHNARREKWMNEEIARFLCKILCGKTNTTRSTFECKQSSTLRSPVFAQFELESFMSVPVSPVPGSPQTARRMSTKELFGSRRGSIF